MKDKIKKTSAFILMLAISTSAAFAQTGSNTQRQTIAPENGQAQQQAQQENPASADAALGHACRNLITMYNRMMSVNIISQKDSGINGTLMRHNTLQRYLNLLVALQCNLKPILDIEETRLRDVEQTSIQTQNNLNTQK